MSLYLFNISVDTADLNPEHIPEDLSINDQESIVEIVVEQILGFDNAIKEYDDNDAEDHNKKSNIKIDLITQHTVVSALNQPSNEAVKQRFAEFNTYLTYGFLELDTPPPKI